MDIRQGGPSGPVVASGNGSGAGWSGIDDIVVQAGPVAYYVSIDWYFAEEALEDQTIFSSVRVTTAGAVVRRSY